MRSGGRRGKVRDTRDRGEVGRVGRRDGEAGVSEEPVLTGGHGGPRGWPTPAVPSQPPGPGTSRPRSPSRKSSSYLMTLSCLGALQESPMLVSDLASARRFMGWPGTGGKQEGGECGEAGLHRLPDSPGNSNPKPGSQHCCLPGPARPGRDASTTSHGLHSPGSAHALESPPTLLFQQGEHCSGLATLSNYCRERTDGNCLGLGVYFHPFFLF